MAVMITFGEKSPFSHWQHDPVAFTVTIGEEGPPFASAVWSCSIHGHY